MLTPKETREIDQYANQCIDSPEELEERLGVQIYNILSSGDGDAQDHLKHIIKIAQLDAAHRAISICLKMIKETLKIEEKDG